MAYRNDELVGVLPLGEQKSWLFGHCLISTPFCVVGGAVADDESARLALEQAALELGRKKNVDYVELRDAKPLPGAREWVSHCHHAVFSQQLPNSDDAILTGIRRKQRAVVRHSMKNGLSWNTEDDVDTCYRIYAESVRNLGTPVFSRRLFRALKAEFGDQCEAFVVRDDSGEAVSAVLNFYFRDQVLPYYGGGCWRARELKSNDFMYYQLMCHAAQRGYTHFDFGRSKIDSGSYKYKQHWGMEETALHYRVALVKAQALPERSPTNPKYAAFISMWKRLPLGLSQQVGPVLSKYLG